MQESFLPIWEDLTHEQRLLYCENVVVSCSGGIDSFYALLKARETWPERLLIVHNQYLPESWSHDIEYLERQCSFVGNCRLVVSQAQRELTGKATKSGAYGTSLVAAHTFYDGTRIGAPLPVDDSWMVARPTNTAGRSINSLLELSVVARNAPPTKKIRFCTDYMKSAVWDRWFSDSELIWTVLVSGERHAESTGRARLPETQWRFGREKNDVYWWRIGLAQTFRETLQYIVDAGATECIPPSYGWQHDSGKNADFIAEYLSEDKEEQGRPRHSCVRCIFTTTRATMNALRHSPEARDHNERTIQAERAMGMTWRQSDKRG